MKKKLIILILLTIIVTGCTNVRNLGKKLDNEEEKINAEKIQFLQENYQNSEVEFVGRLQGSESCKCTQPGPDASCIKQQCEILEDKFVWKYKVCSKKFSNLCIEPEYDDVKQEWSTYSSEEYKYINQVFEILDNYKITYSIYNSNPEGMPSCTIIIKKEKDESDLVDAIKEMDEYYQSIYNNGLQIDSSIVIFDEKDYSFVYKKAEKNDDIHGDYDLYNLLTDGERDFGTTIEKNEIDDYMFECKSSSFSSVAYIIAYEYNSNNLKIWCEGIK